MQAVDQSINLQMQKEELQRRHQLSAHGIYKKYLKRPMDIFLSLWAIIFLLPVLLIVALLVRIKLGGPILFKQKRPGLNEQIFTLYKFRTMAEIRDENGRLLPDEDRLTNFGKFLRSSSLDELPEFINILKGDMSIVGPRPLAAIYLPYYTNEERLRHSVRPGLTGLAQVNGRNIIQWEERFWYDVEYVNHISFINDVKIVFQTILKVFKRSEIGMRGVDAPLDFDVYRRMQAESVLRQDLAGSVSSKMKKQQICRKALEGQ